MGVTLWRPTAGSWVALLKISADVSPPVEGELALVGLPFDEHISSLQVNQWELIIAHRATVG